MTNLRLGALSVVFAATTAKAFLPPSLPPPALASSRSCASTLPIRVSRPDAARLRPWRRPRRSSPDPSNRFSGTRMSAQSDPAGMDTLIDELKAAPDSDTLTLKVSKSVQQVAQPAFFLRIAERAEMAPDDDQKVAFERLAAQVTGALENLMNFVEEKMNDSSSLLQIIVTSAAEKNGEFIVPLSQERLGSLRQSVKIHRDQLDNNFLATVQAWLERCKKEEEMEGMVVILQKILQMYASDAIVERKPGPKRRDPGVGDDVPDLMRRTPAGLLLDRILETDAEQWSGILSSLAVPGKGMAGGVTKEGLLGAVQVAVETVVLQQDNGSMAQRVQAEFLSELCKRIEAAAPQEQCPPPGILE